MFYVYILKNIETKNIYFGYTSDLKRRFKEHQTGKGGVYTKNSKGKLRLVYYEAYYSQKDAIEREQRLKQFKKGYAQLKNRISRCLNEP